MLFASHASCLIYYSSMIFSEKRIFLEDGVLSPSWVLQVGEHTYAKDNDLAALHRPSKCPSSILRSNIIFANGRSFVNQYKHRSRLKIRSYKLPIDVHNPLEKAANSVKYRYQIAIIFHGRKNIQQRIFAGSDSKCYLKLFEARRVDIFKCQVVRMTFRCSITAQLSHGAGTGTPIQLQYHCGAAYLELDSLKEGGPPDSFPCFLCSNAFSIE